MIVILNYGVGNILSIKNMLKKIGHDCLVATSESEVLSASKIILPGVGSFDYGMKKLRSASFFDAFESKARIDKIPVLGICLGAQMLLEESEEGTEKGLGFISGVCRKFDKTRFNTQLPIPNMGWADVRYIKDSLINSQIKSTPRYYFVHSYHMCCDNKEDELAVAEYGYTFTAAINKDNIFGFQFHPEKSHKFGMEILNKFALL